MESSSTPVQGPDSILLVAIPTGDVTDTSPRFICALGEAGIIAAEDTRRLLGPANRLQTRITGTLISLHDHNEADKTECLVDPAEGGARILLVPDAGVPAVSDLGFRVTRAATDRRVQVSAPLDPSVSITALAVPGLLSDRFGFEEFLPREPGEAQAYLLALAHDPHTLIFSKSPKCLNETLRAMAITLSPQRQGVAYYELTETHEETLRGELESLVEQTMGEVLGEITIVIASYQGRGNAGEHVSAVSVLVSEGMGLRDAVAEVAEATSLRKNELYKVALHRKEKG